MKVRMLFGFALMAVTGAGQFNAAYSQTNEFTISSQGEMDGHDGYYQTRTVDGSLMQTDFFFVEGEYLRWYATRPAGNPNFQILPEGTCWVKIYNLRIGDSWNSIFGGPVTAIVTDTGTVATPAGGFFAYKIPHVTAGGDTVLISWVSENTGVVQWWINSYAPLTGYSIVGGDGYYPLAVGNHWTYDFNVGIDEEDCNTPEIVTLIQSYPNPFNSSATISFELDKPSQVTLAIYNVLGQKVATIYEGANEAGKHRVAWDASAQVSGVYFCRIEAGSRSKAKSMILVK